MGWGRAGSECCDAPGEPLQRRPEQKLRPVHICKSGMSSLLQEIFAMDVGLHCYGKACGGFGFAPDSAMGRYEFGFNPAAAPQHFYITLLRSPRAHAYSLYTECRYDSWGRAATHGFDGFPRYANVLKGFEAWIDHFEPTTWHAGDKGDFNCAWAHTCM